MLQMATKLCKLVLPVGGLASLGRSVSLRSLFAPSGEVKWSSEHQLDGLITSNGDAALWVRLCNLGNYPAVRVIDVGGDDSSEPGINPATSFYWATAYPATAEVMDHLGQIERGIQPGNFMPMCVPQPTCEAPTDKRCAKDRGGARAGFASPGARPSCWCERPDGNPRHRFKSSQRRAGREASRRGEVGQARRDQRRYGGLPLPG